MSKGKEMVFAESSTAMVTENLVEDLLGVGSAGDDNVQFLKFSKNGQWLYGADEDVLANDEVLYVNAASFVAGSILWVDGKVAEEDCQPISQRANLKHIDGADAYLGVTFKAMEDGLALSYKASSFGGKKMLKNLMREIGTGLAANGIDKIAMVTLSGDSYKHKKFGTINTPEFTLSGWAGADGVEIKKLAA